VLSEVREALDLDEDRRIVLVDARAKDSVKQAVLTLLEVLIARRRSRQSRNRSLG
jgi:hypothetical protein